MGSIWLIGYSGAGKTTIARELVKKFDNPIWIDADEVRKHLSRDLAFTDDDRKENIRRIIGMCKLLENHTVIVSAISPFEDIRYLARETLNNYFEVWIATPLSVCASRDSKKLYSNNTKQLTGFDSPFEHPCNSELTIEAASIKPEVCAEIIFNGIRHANRQRKGQP